MMVFAIAPEGGLLDPSLSRTTVWRRGREVGDGGRRRASTKSEHLAMLETWLRSYRPEELFDHNGRPRDDILDLAPRGHRRMSANPHPNGSGSFALMRLRSTGT
jgi:phosphoketolase